MLGLIVVIAFGCRLAANILFEGLHEGPSARGFGADAVEFNAIAGNLVRHGEYAIVAGHPTSFRAPGFPLALAGVYAVAGVNNHLAARLFFCLVGAALLVAVFLLAREIAGERTALLAAALAAVYPHLAYYSIHFASEPLFTLLLTLSKWAFLRAMRRNSAAWYLASGLLLGCAALTRPVGFYFFPFYILIALWKRQAPWTSVLARHAVYLAGIAIVVAPWAARNYTAR